VDYQKKYMIVSSPQNVKAEPGTALAAKGKEDGVQELIVKKRPQERSAPRPKTSEDLAPATDVQHDIESQIHEYCEGTTRIMMHLYNRNRALAEENKRLRSQLAARTDTPEEGLFEEETESDEA
jgi:hypothetical protein